MSEPSPACGALLNDAGYCTECDLTPGPREILSEPRKRHRPSTGRDDRVAIALREPRRLLEPIEQ